ncbi:MAG: SDR family NAD(P)-dependent oxidoreductase [bacterium]
MKRVFDFSCALIGLVVLLPFLLAIAIAIKMDSKGPVLFRQKRMGQGGGVFEIIKFRTMVERAWQKGCAITTWNDRRITRVGSFLRKSRLDELPQLLNVLLGDMSLVGPRPELPKYRRIYLGAYDAVLNTKPGITDPATLYFRDEAHLLKGRRDPETFYLTEILPKKLELNLNYLSERNLWRDIKLIFKTLCVSFFPDSTTGLTQYLHGGKSSMVLQQWIINCLPLYAKSSRRRVVKISMDAFLVIAAYFFSFLIRFDGAIPKNELILFYTGLPLLLIISLSSFHRFKLYKGLYEYSSIKDLLLLITAHSVAWSCFVVVQYIVLTHWTPRSVLIIYWLLGLILMGGMRFSYRLVLEMIGIPQGNRIRVLVVGAGAVGEMIIRQMKVDTELGYLPICMVDDDPEKRDVSIHGIPVMGTTKDIRKLVAEKQIGQIIIATKSASASEMRSIVTQCEKAGVVYKTVPGPKEMMNGTVALDQLRGVKIEDLLDRKPVTNDGRKTMALLSGRVVLVTGAGGSIGQELCRQIMIYKPKALVMLDRNENSLFYLENDLKERWASGFHAIVGDICDSKKIEQVLSTHRPSMIFHAAAHKHVPLMELNPEEAIKNNLKGTMTLSKAAQKCNIDRFVLISTDKAVEPVNIMGASKRLAELYVQDANRHCKTKFITVRFGNVLGSNGSVVTLFQKQIANRKPVTVTDPEMTRYFMTISEAVTLILQASALGDGGEIFVLDMGEPVKVVEMARHLISLSGLVPDKDIPISFTGRRPGEKVYERLWEEGEYPQKTEYDKILMAYSNGNGHTNGYLTSKLRKILRYAETMQRQAMFDEIRKLIPCYHVESNGNGVKENMFEEEHF